MHVVPLIVQGGAETVTAGALVYPEPPEVNVLSRPTLIGVEIPSTI
jgi:hypothetical protein